MTLLESSNRTDILGGYLSGIATGIKNIYVLINPYYTEVRRLLMRSTKKKAVTSPTTKTVYANGRIWKKDDLKAFRKYQTSFLSDRYRTFVVRMAKLKDADVIEFMESKDNLTGFLRDILRKKMAEENFVPSKEAMEKIKAANFGSNLSEDDIQKLKEVMIREELEDSEE